MTQIEPITERQYPRRMETKDASEYLRDEHGIPVEPGTLANMRAQRRGPRVVYFGWKPLYERDELDRWAEEDALQPESPLTRRARVRAHRRDEAIEKSAKETITMNADPAEPPAAAISTIVSPTDTSSAAKRGPAPAQCQAAAKVNAIT
jgi:hypothetical protein